ncbi:hypothetical protein [Salmonella enterica]|uniref:hypothetical protein n=1 Tax=Salmonella enterica TaxID=28901 RepID=UPI0026DEFF63|nr:hypothetical protein [Salmonella enterica]
MKSTLEKQIDAAVDTALTDILGSDADNTVTHQVRAGITAGSNPWEDINLCGSFPAVRSITGRRAREISLLMKIFEEVVVVLLFALRN